MRSTRSTSRGVAGMLAGLNPDAPPRLAFVRRAPTGVMGRAGALVCLSASFNPMTTAHAALIEEANRLLRLQETLLLLAIANVDKRGEGLPLMERFDLLVRYAESRPHVSVAAVGHGRFVDKLEAIRIAYPVGTRVVFLLGFDTLVRLFDPKYYADRDASLERLFRDSEVLVANRGADAPSVVAAFLGRPDIAPFAHRIRPIRLPDRLAAVSATDVRARLARGEPITGLVPPEIRASLTARRQRLRSL